MKAKGPRQCLSGQWLDHRNFSGPHAMGCTKAVLDA